MTVRWPENIQPRDCEFYTSFNNSLFESPITRSQQILRRSGDRWMASIAIGPIKRDKAQPLDALLARLQGIAGVVQLWDFARPSPLGVNSEAGAEIVDSRFGDLTTFSDGTVFSFGVVEGIVAYGAHARGVSEIFTRGWSPGITGILKQGDYVQAGRNLAMLTEDANSDSLGRTRLKFSPALRFAVADGEAIVRTQAAAEMRLADNEQARRRVTVGLFYEYQLTFVEAL